MEIFSKKERGVGNLASIENLINKNMSLIYYTYILLGNSTRI
jgi:hypothetical protein